MDTLRLNPLAFPRKPYHYLVKHYQDGQMKRGWVNDSELDARLALEVLENQQRALSAASPDLLASWQWLATADGGVGFDRLFTALRRSPWPSAICCFKCRKIELHQHSSERDSWLGIVSSIECAHIDSHRVF